MKKLELILALLAKIRPITSYSFSTVYQPWYPKCSPNLAECDFWSFEKHSAANLFVQNKTCADTRRLYGIYGFKLGLAQREIHAFLLSKVTLFPTFLTMVFPCKISKSLGWTLNSKCSNNYSFLLSPDILYIHQSKSLPIKLLRTTRAC